MPAGSSRMLARVAASRAVDDLVGERLDVVEAVLVAQRREALGADLAGRHLGVQVAGHVVGLADVGEDELPHVVVALAAASSACTIGIHSPSSNTSRPPAPMP